MSNAMPALKISISISSISIQYLFPIPYNWQSIYLKQIWSGKYSWGNKDRILLKAYTKAKYWNWADLGYSESTILSSVLKHLENGFQLHVYIHTQMYIYLYSKERYTRISLKNTVVFTHPTLPNVQTTEILSWSWRCWVLIWHCP